MPTQGTERGEHLETAREWAVVCSLLVLWTRKMAVEVVECAESVVAEHTDIRGAVPCLLRGIVAIIAVTIGEESVWKGDYVIGVPEPNPSVD